jgi:uncharacterized protein (DUF2237 family)
MMCTNSVRSLAILTASIIGRSHATSSDGSHRNVYGETLASCSRSGVAITGYLRDGYCVDRDGDSGSHHICIDLSSVSSSSTSDGDGSGRNFCQVTGQSDWCSSTDMPCHDDSSSEVCAIENWCVCQWAFASYIEKAGGCDAIQDVHCDAINVRALDAYVENQARYGEALACLVNRCELDPTVYYSSSATVPSRGAMVGLGVGTVLALAAAVAVAAFVIKRMRSRETGVDDGRWKKDDSTAEFSSGGIS